MLVPPLPLSQRHFRRRVWAWFSGGAALGLSGVVYGQTASSNAPIVLPEPLPANVKRVEVREALPAPRYYFDPPSARYHYGLRFALGGGAAWQSDGPADPGATFHLDVSMVVRNPYKLARRGLGGYWQPAVWTTAGYSYAYSFADGNARNFFVGGLGIGGHLMSDEPPRVSDLSALKPGRKKRPTALAIGWTPNIMLGRTLGSFALGVRNVLSVEVWRHIIGVHLSYDFIYVWQGAYIHDAAVAISFDPLGFLHH